MIAAGIHPNIKDRNIVAPCLKHSLNVKVSTRYQVSVLIKITVSIKVHIDSTIVLVFTITD